MNGEYIKKLSIEDFNKIAKPYYNTVIKNPNIDLLKISELLHTRTEVLSDIPEKVDFFDELPEYSNELYVHKKMKTTIENSLENLEKALPVLEALDNFTLKSIEETIMNLVASLGIKNGQLLWPIRTALSGKSMTPGGAFELADILGKEESIKRIKVGIEKLKNNN